MQAILMMLDRYGFLGSRCDGNLQASLYMVVNQMGPRPYAGLLLHPILLGGVLDAGNPQVEQGFSFLYLWRERLGDGLILTTITIWQSQLVCGL